MDEKPKSDARWAQGEVLPGVVTVGDPALRAGAEPVPSADDVRDLCTEMVSRLRELNGAGLAAPQIGVPVRVVVVEVRRTDLFPDRPESPLYVMINPECEVIGSDTEIEWEGCFSVPGLMGKVPRPSRVRVRYLTPVGEEKTEDFEGYLARTIQHEIDHLDGTLFVDRMRDFSTLSTVSNWIRFHHAGGT